MSEGHEIAAQVPYMKLKRWLLKQGAIPEADIHAAAGRPSLVVLMQKHGVAYTGP